MDPVAHTLVGAALAEAGLKRCSRYATATLIVGANLPDIDVIANFWGRDAALYFRRGWTHGVLSLAILPLLLVGTVWLWHRWRGRQDTGSSQLFRLGALTALSFLAVWTHPFLDWLNTYGVRLLMPFDDRWFYGDTLFIIDPWLWLMAAAGVVLVRSQSVTSIAGWSVLGALATLVIWSPAHVSLAVKVTWTAGVACLAALRWKMATPASGETLASAGIVSLIVYVCVMYGIGRTAESVAAENYAQPLAAQANPVPGEPLSQRLILVYDTHYRVVEANGEVHEIPRTEPDEVVRAALAEEDIRGFTNWMRFPYWDVQETATSWIVNFWDLRYQGPGLPQNKIGSARVELQKD